MPLRGWVLSAVLLVASSPALAAPAKGLGAARQALAVGRYADAEKAFSALVQGPDRGLALLGLSRVQLTTGRYVAAEATAVQAAKLPQVAARAYTLQAEALHARGELDAAERAFTLALRDPSALRARVLLGRLLLERGKREQAEPHLHALIDAYNDDRLGDDRGAGLCYVAMAARALRSMHDANDTFREAGLQDEKRVETQLEWASLFLEKYDIRHATESVEQALAHNPESPEAHVLMARLSLQRAMDFPAATEHLERALRVNENLVSAYVVRAGMALRDMDIEVADRELDRALAINPNHLEALSVRAAARFLADDTPGFEQKKREVLRRNPRFSRMFSIIAEYAEWEHRYEELTAMAREALRIDPEDELAYAMLGMNLLRAGDEVGGRKALQEAWKRDRFNVHVFNMLNLYEHVIDKDYEAFSSAPFSLRMHRSERVVLEPYLGPMLTRAYDDMRKRYGFTPQGPLRVELYDEAEHFSVRTTGLPNVGVQGVCFGKVITAISPRAGAFNWGQITWHELAHVFHLQLSKNHVPRWFTEGLAEYETMIARPEWKREEDYDLWLAFEQDRVPRLSDLNRAFTQARTPQALMTAYYASARAVVYLVERFGFDKIALMLAAWGRGQRTPEVFSRVLGIDVTRLDADFRAHERRRLSRYDDDFFVDFSRYEDLKTLRAAAERTPTSASAQAELALGLLVADDFEGAKQAVSRALARDPKHALAHFAATRIALERGDTEGASRSLRAIVDQGIDGYILRVLLARGELASGRNDQARIEAERAVALDPEQLEAYRVLLDVASKLGDEVLGRRVLRAVADLDQHDRIANLALLAALRGSKDWAELVKVGERALYIDPAEPRVHAWLGEARLETKSPEQALFELDRALALDYDKPAKVRLLRARALLALGRRSEAKREVERVATEDPALAKEARALLR
jgi:tetratricopeptide (TPR) repeat protein